MEENQSVIKYLCPRNQLIAKVPMTSNLLFPLRITPNMKGPKNSGDAFKIESKEADKHCNKEEKDNAEIQATFHSEV